MKECCKKYLDEQFGDPDIVGEIYSEYLHSVNEKLEEAHTALDARSWQVLDRAAHTIKGNALAAGDNEMANLAITLRSAANLQDDANAKSLLTRMDELSKEL